MQSDKTAVTASAKASVSAAVAFQALDGALTAPATPAGGSTL